MTSYLQSTVLVTGDLVIAITVTIEGSEHDTERSSPLAEKDEEVVSQRLLREEKTPVVDWTVRERVKKKKEKTGFKLANMHYEQYYNKDK